MKTQTIIRSSVALLALVIVTACGDSSGPTYQDTMSVSDANDLGEGAFIFASNAFASMNFGSPQIGLSFSEAVSRFAAAHGARALATPRLQVDLSTPATIRAGLQAASAAGCTTSATGTDGDVFDPIDANENNVPDDWSVKISCVTHDSAGEVETRVETVHFTFRIKEHTTGLFGFDASQTSDDHEDYTNGDDEQNGYTQINNVSVVAGAATSKFSYSWWFNDLVDGTRETGEGAFEVNAAFDPDGAITAGVDPALPDGELTINGSMQIIDSEDGNIRFVLSTPDPWTYSAGCASGTFIDGTLLGLLNGDENIGFAVDWNACGTGFAFSIFGAEAVAPMTHPSWGRP